MNYETILLTKENGVATLTLNRPERRNAVSMEMYEELGKVTAELSIDDSVNVLVITGAGGAFCAGADQAKKKEGEEAHDMGIGGLFNAMRRKGNRVIQNITEMNKPTIAAVDGAAVGWGFSLAMACDMIIASDKAKFGCAFVNIGLHPDGGAIYFLPRLVGTPKACEMIFTGRIVGAEEADKVGLVTRVVPQDQLMVATQELAQKIAGGPSMAISLSKITLYQGLVSDLSTVLEAESRAQLACVFSEDHKEGVAAFREKRKPNFKGK